MYNVLTSGSSSSAKTGKENGKTLSGVIFRSNVISSTTEVNIKNGGNNKTFLNIHFTDYYFKSQREMLQSSKYDRKNTAP